MDRSRAVEDFFLLRVRNLDHCLDDVVGEVSPERRQPIYDFKAIAKFL